jgi:hypothetical protein
MKRFYPIGTPGQPWTDDDVAAWRAARHLQRSYAEEVLEPLKAIVASQPLYEVRQYGALSIDPDKYPLLAVHIAHAGASAPWALVTGGVHGYETSGVQGALAFLRGAAHAYAGRVNLVVAPCVSPWGYEVIHRWNPRAIDPNRSFHADSPAEESAALWQHIHGLGVSFDLHIDLHETTDTDESEFRPALAARDGKPFTPGSIPDGFYLVDDADDPQPAFHAAMIEAVEQVTHIAPSDDQGQIIGSDVVQPGVIRYAFKPLGLCAGLTDARLTTTTEVYPDSPRATPELCNAAQVAAVRSGLDYLLG